MSDANREAWCLWCDKPGHLTTECWSTHGLNTPAALELRRLSLAASPVSTGADARAAVRGERVVIQLDTLIGLPVTEIEEGIVRLQREYYAAMSDEAGKV